MALGFVVTLTVLVVCIGLIGTCATCLDRTAISRTAAELDHRFLETAPYLGAAALFFLAKRATTGQSERISHALDWDITTEIYAVEGEFVAVLQDIVPEATLEFFSAMYMFGFPFLLVTAPILYFLLPSQRHLKELLIAYLLNYFIGTIFYTLFIAYGPRNHLSSVSGLMYDFYPQAQTMTSAVSSNTNVFPSLHTSLAVVVLVFAWRSRNEYPRWVPIASFRPRASSSTMYLGIHWLIDVPRASSSASEPSGLPTGSSPAWREIGPAPIGDESEDGITSRSKRLSRGPSRS